MKESQSATVLVSYSLIAIWSQCVFVPYLGWGFSLTLCEIHAPISACVVGVYDQISDVMISCAILVCVSVYVGEYVCVCVMDG